MTTLIKRFQPYDFELCKIQEDCGLQEPACWQIANLNDNVGIQFHSPLVMLGSDVIQNGRFTDVIGGGSVGSGEVAHWVLDAGVDWNASTGEACSGNGAVSGNMYQLVTINECQCIRIIFDLATNLNSGCTLAVMLYDGTDWVTIATYVGAINAEEDIIIYHCATTNYSRIGFQFTTDGCDGDKCIDNVRLQIYEHEIYVKDCDGVIQTQIDDCDVIFYTTHWTVEFNWSDYNIPIGCYKICVDNVNFIRNGDFSILLSATSFPDAWTESGSGTAWIPAIGHITAQIPDLSISKLLTQNVSLPSCEYILTFNIDPSGSLDAGVVTVYYNSILIGTFTTGGDKSITFTPLEHIDTISFQVENTGSAGAVVIELTDVAINEDICSKCVCLDTHDCTLLLSGTQDNDASDFGYDNDFTFWLRISAELLDFIGDFDEVIHRESSGQSNLVYGDLLENYLLKIYLQPQYIWKAISRLMIHKEFRINGTEYLKKPGKIEIRWAEGGNFGEGSHTVTNKHQIRRN